MASKKLEQEVASVEKLRQAGVCEETRASLAKALTHRNNYLVSKAAKVAEELGIQELKPDLLRAAERFFEGGAETDPQCWAKFALLHALSELGYGEAEIYVRGLRHTQKEKVWGGTADTAGPLRAHCAHALVSCRQVHDRELLLHLVDVLFDPEPNVRVEAARAVGRIEKSEAALLLRARSLAGDADSEVVGAALSGLVSIDRGEALEFVGRFLEADTPVAAEAALALSGLRTDAACEMLIRRFERSLDPRLKEALRTAIELTRTERGHAFLRERVES